MKKQAIAIIRSYGEIFFIKGTWQGLLLVIVSFVNPNVGIAGMIAVLSGYLFARFIGMKDEFLETGFYTYNPLLVGFSIGYLFEIKLLTVFFLVAAGIATFLLTVAMANIFYNYFLLPVFSLPFVVISSIVYLAALRYTNLFVSAGYPAGIGYLDHMMPVWLSGFFQSLGSIFFLPTVLPGIVFAIVILATSRILFMLAVAGYFSGTFLSALLVGSTNQAFADINHFNFILIAMVVGGVFLIPSVRSYVLAIVAVFISTFFLAAVQVFWSNYGIPGFTLPFNVVSLTFIYVLGLIGYPLMVRYLRDTPEETLDDYIANINRFSGNDRKLTLPFSGTWTVWQGIDGKWTHKGTWKYAFDFVITDDEGETYSNGGVSLDDYYCYRKPVLSPVRGRVVNVIQSLPDNPIGEVDKVNNWGNLIIIKSEESYYVEISHFVPDSVKIKEGEWVERGTFLGLCGNSGYSPQPHIHVQVQAAEQIGSATLPFGFVSYLNGGQFFANAIPEEGDKLEPLHEDKSMSNKMTYLLEKEWIYEVIENGAKLYEVRLKTDMESDGTMYWKSDDSRVYFGKNEGAFFQYRMVGKDEYLKKIFAALPRMPLMYRENMEWKDTIPLGLVLSPSKAALFRFLSSFNHHLACVETTSRFHSANQISTEISYPVTGLREKAEVQLDDEQGIKMISIGKLKMIKVENDKKMVSDTIVGSTF